MSETVDLTERTVGGLHAYLETVVTAKVDRGARILDVGAGTGAWLARLQGLGYADLHGLEYAPLAPLPGIDIHRFDLNHDDPTSFGQFDLVTCIEVIEHVENIGKLLDCIQAALKPDGLAIVTTPNLESLSARIRGVLVGELPHFDTRSDPTHLMPILRASLTKMLDRRAMRIEALLAYPQDPRTSLMFSPKVRTLRNLASAFLKDPVPGDNTVYLIRHAVYNRVAAV